MSDSRSGRTLAAFASIDGVAVDQHFGHARYWQVYNLEGDVEFVETRKMPASCSGTCSGNFDAAYEVLKDCAAIFVSKIGEVAAAYMIGKGIKVYEAAGSIDRLIYALKEAGYGKDI